MSPFLYLLYIFYLKFLYFQHAIAINVTVLRMRREKNLLLKPWYLLFVVSVPHELVSTKWYRLPRIEYQPHLRNASITCCVWVYFFCFIIFIISEASCLLCLQVFAFAILPTSSRLDVFCFSTRIQFLTEKTKLLLPAAF